MKGRFIEKPGLPKYNVKAVVMSSEYPDLVLAVEKLGINVITVDKNIHLPDPVAYHADLQLLHLGKNIFVTSPECSKFESHLNNEEKKEVELHFLKKHLGEIYPEDISLNFLLLQNYCIGRIDCLDQSIQKLLIRYHYKLIACRQGYCRCSTALVTETAAITADISIYKLLIELGLDVLLIEPGDILLHGYNYGFIGGCCCKVSKNEMLFTGCFEEYKNGKQIIEFLNKYETTPVYLPYTKLIDIGGIIPIIEQNK